MRKYFLIILAVFLSINLKAQKHEIGMSLGAPNIIGDVGKTNYLQPFQALEKPYKDLPMSIGVLYRLNFNARQSLRFGLAYNKVYFNDTKAKEDYRKERGLKGSNNIVEASAAFEYHFFDINDERYFGISPYIFAGIAGFISNDRKYELNYTATQDPVTGDIIGYKKEVKTKNNLSDFGMAIPFGAGVKVKFNYRWALSFEVGVRYTNSDNLDYSNMGENKYTVNVDPLLNDPVLSSVIIEDKDKHVGTGRTGNINSKDWYVVTGLHLTYTFGRPPCNCW